MIIFGQRGSYHMDSYHMIELYIVMGLLTVLAFYRHKKNKSYRCSYALPALKIKIKWKIMPQNTPSCCIKAQKRQDISIRISKYCSYDQDGCNTLQTVTQQIQCSGLWLADFYNLRNCILWIVFPDTLCFTVFGKCISGCIYQYDHIWTEGFLSYGFLSYDRALYCYGTLDSTGILQT